MAKEMTNQELAAAWTAAILVKLYQAYPERITLDARTIMAEVGTELDYYRAGKLWGGLWQSLEQAGLFTCTRGNDSHARASRFFGPEGLGALRRPLPGTEQSWGDRLAEIAKRGGTAAAVEGGKRIGGQVAEKAAELAQAASEFLRGLG